MGRFLWIRGEDVVVIWIWVVQVASDATSALRDPCTVGVRTKYGTTTSCAAHIWDGLGLCPTERWPLLRWLPSSEGCWHSLLRPRRRARQPERPLTGPKNRVIDLELGSHATRNSCSS